MNGFNKLDCLSMASLSRIDQCDTLAYGTDVVAAPAYCVHVHEVGYNCSMSGGKGTLFDGYKNFFIVIIFIVLFCLKLLVNNSKVKFH